VWRRGGGLTFRGGTSFGNTTIFSFGDLSRTGNSSGPAFGNSSGSMFGNTSGTVFGLGNRSGIMVDNTSGVRQHLRQHVRQHQQAAAHSAIEVKVASAVATEVKEGVVAMMSSTCLTMPTNMLHARGMFKLQLLHHARSST
jgi:hypothetical protein